MSNIHFFHEKHKGPTKNNDGEDCPLVCNVECGEHELLCPEPNDERGCKTPDLCVAKGMGADGKSCPDVAIVCCDIGPQIIMLLMTNLTCDCVELLRFQVLLLV